LTDKIN